MNDLINNATQEFDTAKRQQMLTQMQQRTLDLVSHLPTHHNVMIGLTSPKTTDWNLVHSSSQPITSATRGSYDLPERKRCLTRRWPVCA